MMAARIESESLWRHQKWYAVPRTARLLPKWDLIGCSKVVSYYCGDRAPLDIRAWVPVSKLEDDNVSADILVSKNVLERKGGDVRLIWDGPGSLCLRKLPMRVAEKDTSDLGRGDDSQRVALAHVHRTLGELTLPERWVPHGDDNYRAARMQRAARKLVSRAFNVKMGPKVGRMYHTLCVGGSRELRGEVLHSGCKLVELDIKTAYPTMLQVLVHADEREAYRRMLGTGDIYSALGAGVARGEAKVQMMKLLAGYVMPELAVHSHFRRMFPMTAKLFCDMRVRGESLQAQLQSLEGEVVVSGVGVWAAGCDLPFVPVHDGLLCRPEDEAVFADALRSYFAHHVGVPAQVVRKS